MILFDKYYKDKGEFKNLNLTLNRIDGALKAARFDPAGLGKIVHVAGTNGKGSTSFFIAQILRKRGFKTALFTSPHIFRVNERISLNTTEAEDDELNGIFRTYEDVFGDFGLSYFEGIFFIAALWFMKNNPDYTVLETGLGGRFDATNSSLLTEKTCVITSISQDHANYLGPNIYGIIDEKLGILRKNFPLVLAPNKKFVKDYIKNKFEGTIIEAKASEFAKKNYPFPYSENYSTATAAAKILLNEKLPDYSSLLLPPCRLETAGRVILDGSHNPAGLLALLKSGRVPPGTPVLFTSTKDRDLTRIFNVISKIGGKTVLTSLPGNPRSIGKDEASALGIDFEENPVKAFERLREETRDEDMLVTGSFYLCSIIKKHLSGND